MSSTVTVLRIDLMESFRLLQQTLIDCCTAIRRDAQLPAWVSRTGEELAAGLESRAKAMDLYRALWYEEGQDGRETLTCPGIVGASADTLDAARTCNAAKDAFKSAVLALKNLPKPEAQRLMADLHRRDEDVAAAMRRMGVSRLHLKQAYRHLPLLDERPGKIGFTWSKQGRMIQRTRVEDARRLLERRRESPQVLSDLDRLGGLASNEVLARVRSVCTHVRANIVFNGSGEVRRRLMQAPLPILIPLRASESLPDFVPVPPEPPDNPRLRRSDVRIEDEVFLPSIRVYRYKLSYRTR